MFCLCNLYNRVSVQKAAPFDGAASAGLLNGVHSKPTTNALSYSIALTCSTKGIIYSPDDTS